MGIQAAPWRFGATCRKGTMPCASLEAETSRSQIVGRNAPDRPGSGYPGRTSAEGAESVAIHRYHPFSEHRAVGPPC